MIREAGGFAGREKLAVPKLALGAMAAGDAWTIKAHSEAAAAAASDIKVHRATVNISNAHIGPASTFSSSRHKLSRERVSTWAARVCGSLFPYEVCLWSWLCSSAALRDQGLMLGRIPDSRTLARPRP
jgi:hypothetical protein